jgi:hypothetical protein
MFRFSPSGFAARWNDLAQYEDTADDLVLGGLLDDHGQARHLSSALPEHTIRQKAGQDW